MNVISDFPAPENYNCLDITGICKYVESDISRTLRIDGLVLAFVDISILAVPVDCFPRLMMSRWFAYL